MEQLEEYGRITIVVRQGKGPSEMSINASKNYHDEKAREWGVILRDWYNSQSWRSCTLVVED